MIRFTTGLFGLVFIITMFTVCANKHGDHISNDSIDTLHNSPQETVKMSDGMWQKSYSTSSGITMKIIEPEIIQNPIESIVVELHNELNVEGGTSDWYYMQQLSDDGIWKNLPLAKKYHDPDHPLAVVWFMDMMIIDPYKSRKIKISPYIYEPNLAPGIYRIGKRFSFTTYSTEKIDTVYVEFEIK